jgi:hypothetical protein
VHEGTLVTGCIAPFALSPEVTNTIPQETLGGMITCDFDAITTRFEAFYAASAQAGQGQGWLPWRHSFTDWSPSPLLYTLLALYVV